MLERTTQQPFSPRHGIVFCRSELCRDNLPRFIRRRRRAPISWFIFLLAATSALAPAASAQDAPAAQRNQTQEQAQEDDQQAQQSDSRLPLAAWQQAAEAALPAAPAANDDSSQTSALSAEQAPQQQSPQPQSQPGQMSKEQKNEAYEQQTGTSKDRLGFVLPNFLTIDEVGKVPRLTWQQKFEVQTRSSVDWTKVPWYAFLAGISQATNSEPALGQGGVGYAKRLGITAADNTIENYWTSAIMPSLLHQDPRFYVLPSGSIPHRIAYPLEHIFVTRGDSGRREFNFSEVFGSVIAAAISTYTYHLRSERNFANVGDVWWHQVAYDSVSFEAKEFWPLLRIRLQKHKNAAQGVAPIQP